MTPRLDPRLRAAADAVRPGAVAADVGTDHGYLICALVSSGKCPRGFASDINRDPLEAARRQIRSQGLESRIATVLSDGLSGLPGEEIDDVVIAGMGGELIAEIVGSCRWLCGPDKRLVLQPMTRAGHLRRELHRMGFRLEEETAVRSGRFVYSVMTASYTGEEREIDDLFAETGLLFEQEGQAVADYLDQVYQRLRKQAEGLERSKNQNETSREALDRLRALCGAIHERIEACTL